MWASTSLSMEDPSPAAAALRARGRTRRAGGGAPASQLDTWGLWFQGPATRAPQDATGGSGVGVGEEAGGATPSGDAAPRTEEPAMADAQAARPYKQEPGSPPPDVVQGNFCWL